VPGKRPNVLIVDDDPTARHVASHLIRRDPRFRVTAVAMDGVEALDLTKDACPDLIVLDDDMPRMGGVEVLPHLRAQCPDARIVVWSLDATARDAAEAAGSDGFISTSEPIERLIDWLRAA
jgi:CheY-like chemotaxis protein